MCLDRYDPAAQQLTAPSDQNPNQQDENAVPLALPGHYVQHAIQ